MTPENYTTNTDTLTKKIYIEFDEFVQLVDQQKEFFSSPKMKLTPQLTIRGRGVVVTLRDTLKPNTTYALNFGSTIRDNNESNPLNSMRYVFSTGDEIDSMIVSGYTEDSYKADSASKTFIYFFPADSVVYNEEYDSTMLNMSPAVIARAEQNGIFIAQNLKPIDYYAYAILDDNNNSIYEPGTDQVGFLDSIINPTKLGDFSIWYDTIRQYVVADPQIHFRIFTDQPFQRQLLNESGRPLQHKAMLYFNSDYPVIDSIIFEGIPSDKIIIEAETDGNDTLALWFDMPAEMLPDTIKGDIYYFKHDSVREFIQVKESLKLAWKYFESKSEAQAREKQEKERAETEERGEVWVEPEKANTFKSSSTIQPNMNPEKLLSFEFQYPIRSIDSASIKLLRMSADEAKAAKELEDKAKSDSTIIVSEIYRGVENAFTLRQDTQLIRTWHITPEWSETEDDQYYLVIPKGAITNIIGESNDSITNQFQSLKMEDFATIVVNVDSSEDDESEYILELLNGSTLIERKEGLKKGVVTFNYVAVGEVTLRILQDKNKNGKWDSGDLIKRRQPELSKIYTDDGNSKITTKANWEIELTLDTKKMFAPESAEELAQRLRQQEIDRLAEEAYQKALKGEQGGQNSGGGQSGGFGFGGLGGVL